MRTPVVLGTLLLGVAVGGCGDGGGSASSVATSTPTVAAAPLTQQQMIGKELVSTSVVGHAMSPGTRVSLAFRPDGTIIFSGGCNAMGTVADLDRGVLRLAGDRVGSTRMACRPRRVEAQDRWVAALLRGGTAFRRTSAGFALVHAATRIDLVQAPSRVLHPTAGQETWILESYGAVGGAPTTVPTGVPPPSLRFQPDGRVTVFTGCNHGEAQALYAVGSIAFRPFFTDEMRCTGVRGTLERRVLSVLRGGRVAYRFRGPDLRLTRAGRELTYRPRR
jgi:heat shock protein HslJ